ncbi:hypothetical protein Pelo_19775 [Pelomyxa schiedti]|nr:hypothetical protein Pelo_19775 [Pelomyxa schiedti]
MEANSSIMSRATTNTSTLLPSVATNIEVEVLAREWHWRMSEAYGKEEGEDKAIALLFTAPNSLARARRIWLKKRNPLSEERFRFASTV